MAQATCINVKTVTITFLVTFSFMVSATVIYGDLKDEVHLIIYCGWQLR
jgi:hypothetical protein